MAKIYAVPKEIGKPRETDYSKGDDWETADNEYLEKLCNYCKSISKDKYTGFVLRLPHADGYAIYMVIKSKPLELFHVPIGDCWRVPSYAEKGLSLNDIKN